MQAFVVDASVAIAWCTPTQASPATDRLLDDIVAGSTAFVPPLWLYEVANALLTLWRRKRLNANDYSEARMLLDRLRISIDQDGPRLATSRVADLAKEHGLTVYDAAYLELAIRKQIPLASGDRSIQRAAKKSGVILLV
jgi:predicted nucleic acid-binding protein